MIGGLLLLSSGVLLAAGACLRRHTRAWVSLTVAGCVFAAASALSVSFLGAWEFKSALRLGGELVQLRMDPLSAFFLILISVLGAAGALYSVQYWPVQEHPRSAPAGRILWNTLLAAMGLVLCCANGLHFLIAWEVFTVTGYFLITVERRKLEVRRAGWLYLAASHTGTLCLFGFFAYVAATTNSWSLGPMHGHPELAPVFWLALFGFGLKAGLFPLHIWLPSAHANAPTHVSAILSGAAIKMGIYGIVRFSGWLPLPQGAGWVVLVLGAVSAVLGVAFALGQHDIKRLLAYHSVENIGIILLGLGLAILSRQTGLGDWGILAFAGGMLHVWNHGVFKALLFLGAGSVIHATGTRHMSSLGGLWRKMPWTASLFALGAAAISGLPPLNGFVSEWLVYLGLFDVIGGRGPTAWAAVPATIALAVTGALALACFVKVVGIVFLGLPRSEAAANAHECGPFMRVPMILLAVVCVFIGLVPMLIAPILSKLVSTWNPAWSGFELASSLTRVGVANLVFVVLALTASWALLSRVKVNGVRRSVTWDCGYAAPTARMQYTAGSFASTITEWFGWILRPERHRTGPEGVFPATALASEHTPETVLEKVITPAGRQVMRLSAAARRLQHGRLQFYILYLVIGLVALALIAWLGGGL